MVEEELQAAIEHRPLRQVIVIQHQQQRLTIVKALSELIEQTVEPLLEGEGLVTLAHFQQAESIFAQTRVKLLQALQQTLEKTPRIMVAFTETEPEAVPVIG